MGMTYKPEDTKRRKRIDKALEDLDPSTRDSVKRIIEDYHGEDLDKKLSELISYSRMKKLMEKK